MSLPSHLRASSSSVVAAYEGYLPVLKMKGDVSGQVNLANNSAAHDTIPSWQPDP